MSRPLRHHAHLAPALPHAVERCRAETPPLAPVEPGHLVACHRVRELSLRGIAS